MRTPPLALAHTYYLPRSRRAIGPAARQLAELLGEVWSALSGDSPAEYHDGVSAWVDRAGTAWMVVVRGREVTPVVDPAILGATQEALLRALGREALDEALRRVA